jgi:hypothetical protein
MIADNPSTLWSLAKINPACGPTCALELKFCVRLNSGKVDLLTFILTIEDVLSRMRNSGLF